MPAGSQGFTLADAAEIASIVAAVGIVGVIGIIYQAAASGLRSTFLSRRDLAARLDRLACGVTGDYLATLFGAPVFRRDVSLIKDNPAEVSDRIYRTRHAWVQALVSRSDDSVQCFSITVTDPRFRFSVRRLTFDRLDVRLGSSQFSGVSHPPDGWMSRAGARRFAYAESHWFGNPGCYQPYVLAFNDAGIGRYVIPRRDGPVVISGGRLSAEAGYRPFVNLDLLPGWLQPARNQTTVNTLTVLGAGAQPGLVDIAGVDSDRVRVLRDPGRDRRARRRLSRKVRQSRRAARQQLAPPALPGDLPVD